jgi:Aspartic acid proteinase inhibitor
MNYPKTLAIFAAFIIITISSAICQAQPRIAGGYSAVSNSDETVIEAANFAVETQAQKDDTLELISIERAERQIVAGSNYRMCLSVKSNGKEEQASATVYLNLQNQFSLSEWTPGKCAEGETKETPNIDDVEAANESETFAGKLEVGKTGSLILYFGAESGDYAAFCFKNNSEAGRAILNACKNGEQCEFTGDIDYSTPCKVKTLKADLSASGEIVAVSSVRSLTAKKKIAVSSRDLAPDLVVKNLYAAQKNPKTAPFFQTTNRAAVDKYFEDDFADLIWDDAVKANGEVGTIEADPLYNSQDQKVTAFVIGKPEYSDDIATVLVKFKNFGKAETVKFILEKQADKSWKVIDIGYQNGEMLNSLLFDAKLQAESK